MIGQVEISDREIVDAVAAVEGEMLEVRERERTIGEALDHAADLQEFVAAFLEPPLYSTGYGSGMGTLYTAVYKPGSGSAEYRWPGVAWEHSFERFGAGAIRLLESSAA